MGLAFRVRRFLPLLLLLGAGPLRAQTTDLPGRGVNIAWGFVYACPPDGDPTCAPNVEYSALAAYAYTDAQAGRGRAEAGRGRAGQPEVRDSARIAQFTLSAFCRRLGSGFPRVNHGQPHNREIAHIAGHDGEVVLQRSCGQQAVYD